MIKRRIRLGAIALAVILKPMCVEGSNKGRRQVGYFGRGQSVLKTS